MLILIIVPDHVLVNIYIETRGFQGDEHKNYGIMGYDTI
jgi:hypothetical protein